MFTVQQAAAKLGLSRQRVHILIQQGRIVAQKLGKVWIVRSLKIKPPA